MSAHQQLIADDVSLEIGNVDTAAASTEKHQVEKITLECSMFSRIFSNLNYIQYCYSVALVLFSLES